ncbi:11794_t:CDS:2 [Cetraspora pellucida]|uniref:11794_t:CDS:1 n=1 Tax=Cetraspora pellucida TaxID=1433469 RepID=A0ACA9KNR6_9GLOM|nr:11794_t:CDS:2 [Cetraspora pellucida]
MFCYENICDKQNFVVGDDCDEQLLVMATFYDGQHCTVVDSVLLVVAV